MLWNEILATMPNGTHTHHIADTSDERVDEKKCGYIKQFKY